MAKPCALQLVNKHIGRDLDKRFGILFFILFLAYPALAQETNCDIAGLVTNQNGEPLNGASVEVIHEPTRNLYKTRTNSQGAFHLVNIKPGGPYLITISFVGFQTVTQGSLFTHLNSESFYSSNHGREVSVFKLREHVTELAAVAIRGKSVGEKFIGIETNITRALMKDMPSISRNFQDYARMTPQAKVNAEGGLSFAGQNNRFNAFFIDGASGQDLLGVSLSGISGGQTSTPPISMDAIEEVRIMISPYEVQYGNFTGASVNAITKSGSNQLKSAAWYYFRNEDMAGKTPGSVNRAKLSAFYNNTMGASVSGPLIRDKVFHFTSLEWQKEDQPQPFDVNEYKGNSSPQQLQALKDTVMTRYGYDPGRYDLTFNSLRAIRFITKLDWNASVRHKFSFTYRLNSAERATPLQSSGSNMVRFHNNGYEIITNNHFASFEWRSFFNNKLNSRLLLAYNGQKDDRQILGKPFPLVNIQDGSGTIVLGPNGASQISLFKGKDLSLQDVFKLVHGRHVYTFGVDLNMSWLNDLILGSYYGSYLYRKLEDFMTDAYAIRYQRSFFNTEESVNDESTARGASFMTSRIGFFLQDELKFNPDLKLRYGLRVDGNSWNTDYPADEYFNSVAVPAISAYYDLKGARSGAVPKTHWQLQPRVELSARLPAENVTLKFGGGIFTGHIINIWPSDIYNYRTVSLDIPPASYNLRFNPDANSQPGYSTLGMDPAKSKGQIVIVSKHFRYPTVWRMSSSIGKMIGKGWNTSVEFLLTKNIHEIRYTNVNIIPPALRSTNPGSRVVYAASGPPPQVAMDGGNPYSSVLLMANNEEHKGYAYSVSATISSPSSTRSNFIASYTYGHSKAIFEPTGLSGPNFQQWRSLETINGRNMALRSTSDFDLAHRIFVYGMRTFSYAKGRLSTTFSFFYQGQSGQPYSYVYERSMVNDFGQNERFDLIYVPTSKELEQMTFLPTNDGNISYSPEQQKAMFEAFIESDRYLRSIRGSFSERNKARLPFTHSVDIRIQQEFYIKAGKNNLKAAVIFDVFNFLNMLNPEWGMVYAMPGDNIALIRFEKFTSSTDITPQYQFKTSPGAPWSVQTSTAPGNSARWISQLGFRLNF